MPIVFKCEPIMSTLQRMLLIVFLFGSSLLIHGCAPAPVESASILAREPVTASAEVKHVLVSWKDLASVYERGGGIDKRAADREKDAADQLARDLLKRARAGEPFEELMKEFSEDPGSATDGRAYPVTQAGGLVQEFKDLALRLEVDEVGVVQSQFGWHVMKRVK